MFGTWILDMNGHTRKLFLVAIGVMLWAFWLSRNDIVLLIKTQFCFICMLSIRYTLDQDVVIVLKGGRAQIIARCLPFVGEGDNGDFCKK
jgi:hypothetical protein